jgi:hypothetical protein
LRIEASPRLRHHTSLSFPNGSRGQQDFETTYFPHTFTTTMSPPTDRKAILEGLRQCIKDGKIIVGAGAGIGLSAKLIEQGGGDMIIIYNSGRYRMAGRGSLAGLMPYGNANDVVLEMVRQQSEPQVT